MRTVSVPQPAALPGRRGRGQGPDRELLAISLSVERGAARRTGGPRPVLDDCPADSYRPESAVLHQDPAALLVAHHLVGRGAADLVQLHGRQHLPAAAALAAAQRPPRPTAAGGWRGSCRTGRAARRARRRPPRRAPAAALAACSSISATAASRRAVGGGDVGGDGLRLAARAVAQRLRRSRGAPSARARPPPGHPGACAARRPRTAATRARARSTPGPRSSRWLSRRCGPVTCSTSFSARDRSRSRSARLVSAIVIASLTFAARSASWSSSAFSGRVRRRWSSLPSSVSRSASSSSRSCASGDAFTKGNVSRPRGRCRMVDTSAWGSLG